MAYAVEKGIAQPRNGRKGAEEVYPWTRMDVGDSFFVPNGKQSIISNCAGAAKKRGRGTFTTRAVDGGVRVWRIA